VVERIGETGAAIGALALQKVPRRLRRAAQRGRLDETLVGQQHGEQRSDRFPGLALHPPFIGLALGRPTHADRVGLDIVQLEQDRGVVLA